MKMRMMKKKTMMRLKKQIIMEIRGEHRNRVPVLGTRTAMELPYLEQEPLSFLEPPYAVSVQVLSLLEPLTPG